MEISAFVSPLRGERLSPVPVTDVDFHTSRYDLGEINTVAEKLEHGEIDGRAVITP